MFSGGTLGDGIIDNLMGVSAGVSSTGNLAEIRMQADNPGTFTIGLSDAGVGTATDALTTNINNGTVTVADTTPPTISSVTLSPTSVAPGGSVTVTVVATDASGIAGVTADGTTGTVTLTNTGGDTWQGTITAPGTAGTYNVTVVATDAATNSNTATDTSASFTVAPPAITSWGNNKTDNNSTTITVNESESVGFNATADQTIDTWHWCNNGTDQLSNFDNYTASWSVNGTNTVSVNATNANGTTNTKTWTITVNDITAPVPVTGLVNDTPAATMVNLSWDANSESDLVRYRVYRNGSLIDSPPKSQTHCNVTGLSPSTTYEFNVSAYDDNDLEGENASIVVTTAVGPFHHIEVTPTSKTLNINESWNFTAAGFDQNDGKISGLVFAWSRSDVYIGSLTEINDTTTNFTAEHVGIIYLTASNGSVTSDQVQVTVNGAANNTNVTNETATVTSGDATVTCNLSKGVTGWINITAIGNATNSSEVNSSRPRYGLGDGDRGVSGVTVNVSQSIIDAMANGSTIRIRICYNDTTLAALGIDASTLAIWKYNSTTGWVKQPSTRSGTCVYVDVSHLCPLGLFGSKAASTPSGGSSGGSGTYPPGWFGTQAPAVTATKAPAASTTATDAPPDERVTPAPTKKTAAAKAAAPAAEGTTAETAKKDAPGFTAVFVIAGLLAVAYAMMRHRA
jgi:PGF-CTERM protein